MKFFTIFLLTCINLSANAQWSSNNSINNAICNFTGDQMTVQVTSDGAGGAICTWVDTRNGSQDIYAQRIDATGNLQWNVDGIAICNAVSDQFTPKIASDGSGGAIIVWYDNRNGNWDIYAQKINATGTVQWTTDGVGICTSAGNQNAQQIIGDGAGGAFIVWSDGRISGGADADIYAQRINAAGTALWNTNGSLVSNAISLQNIPSIVSDGVGGVIIAWEDWRNFSQTDIYAQRMSSNGFPSWSNNGVIICSDGSFANQYNTKIISDGSGGAIICWLDNRNFSTGLDIYAQRVNSSGTTQWISNGLAVCISPFVQTAQQMVADGANGAIIVWDDRRSGGRDIYAQRINGSGAAQWTINGIAICNNGATQSEPQFVTRASGGALIIWTDYRNAGLEDIYAQSVSATGSVLWTGNGVPVVNQSTSQYAAQLISDGADGAIIAWQDSRNVSFDIYSSKLFSTGTLPVRLLDFKVVSGLDFVTLQWKTDNEINNRGFEIQRSQDGTNWQKNDFIAAGTSTAIQNYQWKDNAPLTGKSFYRLKQIDNDGRFEYSKVLSVTRNAKTTVSVYPNPAREIIQVNFGRVISDGKLQLYNGFGQLVLTEVVTQQSTIRIKINSLPAGIYTLNITAGEDRTTTKIIIE